MEPCCFSVGDSHMTSRRIIRKFYFLGYVVSSGWNLLRIRKDSVLLFFLVTLLTVCVVELPCFQDRHTNVSAVVSLGYIGIYWDENCSKGVDSIDWGVISIDETIEICTYVRNEGNDTVFLALKATNWNPESASNYLDFSWSYNGKGIEVGRVARVTLSLHISPLTRGISNFSFDIIFVRGQSPDIDGDGDVDIFDAVILSAASGFTPGDENWNPDADLNGDLTIDVFDAVILSSHA